MQFISRNDRCQKTSVFGIAITTPLYADQVLTTEKPADNVYALVGPITNRIP